MFCENCGKPLEKGDRFCQYCGAVVNWEEEFGNSRQQETVWNENDTENNTENNTKNDAKPIDGGNQSLKYSTGKNTVGKWIAAAAVVVVMVIAAVVITITVRGRSENEKQEVVSLQEDMESVADHTESEDESQANDADANSADAKTEEARIPTLEPQDLEALEKEEQAAKEAEEKAAREAEEQAAREAEEKAAREAEEKAIKEAEEKAQTASTVEVYYGLTASTEDFIFPYSSTLVLTDADLTILEADTVDEEHYRSQLAINEILARYGYPFDPEKSETSKDAYDQFAGLDWYEAAKAQCPYSKGAEVLANMNSVEKQNVSILNEWQKAHGCYY